MYTIWGQHVVNMLYNIILLEPSIFFYVLYDYDCDYNMYNWYMISFFFFLNQQFITWHVVADHGSYFVTIYNRSRLHEEMEKEREMENRKRTKEANRKNPKREIEGIVQVVPKSIWSNGVQIVYKCESFGVSYQEHDKMT